MGKKCTKCGEVKPLNEFYKRASAKDGFQSYCKDCKHAHQRQWARENVERVRAWREAYFAGGRTIKPLTETPTYSAVHLRLRATNGPASKHQCTLCRGEASDWAYRNDCKDELRAMNNGYEVGYCVHIDCYQPLCRKCHRAYDRKTVTTN